MPDDERTQPSDPASPPTAASAMELAEAEARAYLERAKGRADSLVATVAEAAARAGESLDDSGGAREIVDARRVAEAMVCERQRRLAALSGGIAQRAARLTAGMDDAERVRAQFDSFLRSLAATADRVARESGTGRDAARGRGSSRAPDVAAA